MQAETQKYNKQILKSAWSIWNRVYAPLAGLSLTETLNIRRYHRRRVDKKWVECLFVCFFFS